MQVTVFGLLLCLISFMQNMVYPAVSSLAGIMAGMFGVGGGIVKVRHSPCTVSYLTHVHALRSMHDDCLAALKSELQCFVT